MGQSKPGPQGPLGPQGPQGEQGIQGTQGTQGISTIPGPTGSQGLQGLQGTQGTPSTIPGPRGETGNKGDKGDKGDRGDKGDSGTKGDQGLKGADGEVTNAFMKANTLWCADGEVCKLPSNKKSIFLGVNNTDTVHITQNGIFTKSSDPSEWVGLGIDKGYIFRNSDTRVVDGGAKTMTIRNDDGNLRLMASTNNIQLPLSTALQFGEGFEREANAGQISYGRHDGGADGTLNIIGGGKNGQQRVVRVWDSLRIGDTHLRQDDDWLRLVGDKNKVDDYNKGLAAKNLWAKDKIFAASRDILAELDDLRANVIRKDRQYYVRSNRGGLLIDAGGWSQNKGEWETMKFEQR